MTSYLAFGFAYQCRLKMALLFIYGIACLAVTQLNFSIGLDWDVLTYATLHIGR